MLLIHASILLRFLQYAAYCTILRDFISIQYAVGMLPLDTYAGYALPGGVFEAGVIPAIQALVLTDETLANQTKALMEYHSQPSAVAAQLPNVSNQILFLR